MKKENVKGIHQECPQFQGSRIEGGSQELNAKEKEKKGHVLKPRKNMVLNMF